MLLYIYSNYAPIWDSKNENEGIHYPSIFCVNRNYSSFEDDDGEQKQKLNPVKSWLKNYQSVKNLPISAIC